MRAGEAPGVAASAGDAMIAELVAANHVLAMLRLVDAFGHISARDPENPEKFWMARGMAPELVTADDIWDFDLNSNPAQPERGMGSIERFIHGEIYKARPDVMSVVHSHSPRVIPFSVSQAQLRPINHTGAFLLPEVPVFDQRDVAGASDFMISSNALGKSLAETLGGASVALLAAHGDVVVAHTIGLAVYRTYFTDKTAELLMQALGLGGKVRYLHDDEAELAGGLRNTGYVRQWELWKRQADARNTDGRI